MMIRPDNPRLPPVHLRKELLERGFNDRAISRATRLGDLCRVRHGAYVAGQAWAKLDEDGRYAVRTRAVLKQAKCDVAVSHASALPEYDAPLWGQDLSVTHVTRTDGRAGRKEAGVQQHCGALDEGEVITRNGIPVLGPTRTALDVTTVCGVEAALVAVNHLLHAKLTTPEKLQARYDAGMDHWPNTLATDVVLRLMDARCESVGETRTFFLCWDQHLPAPELQYKIRDEDGEVVARVDFAWPALGVFLEFDGKVKYAGLLKEGESASDVVVREKKREDLIRRLTGWRCIRITWADLETPEATAAMIRRILFSTSAR